MGGRPERVEPARARRHARRGRARATIPTTRTRRAVAERLLRRALGVRSDSRRDRLPRDRAGPPASASARRSRSRRRRRAATSAARRSARPPSTRPGELAGALELLDPETRASTTPEELAELAASIARHAPQHLAAVARAAAATTPRSCRTSTTRASRSSDLQALQILRRVLSLPGAAEPDAGEARTALVMAWNNACIHAHALGDYRARRRARRWRASGSRPRTRTSITRRRARTPRSAQIDRALAQVAARDRARLRARREDGDRRRSRRRCTAIRGSPRCSSTGAPSAPISTRSSDRAR